MDIESNVIGGPPWHRDEKPDCPHWPPSAPDLASTRPRDEQPELLHDLERAGTLTRYQGDWLRAVWPDLGDWAASPYFGTVREHTRAYIERESRRALAAAAPATPTTKEPIPHA